MDDQKEEIENLRKQIKSLKISLMLTQISTIAFTIIFGCQCLRSIQNYHYLLQQVRMCLGCGTTNDRGIAIVDIDPAFSETINSGIEYQVFLQKEGDGDIWVAEKEESYFTVRGTPNLKFSWEVKCIQKSFEHLRLDEKEVQEAAQKDNRDAKKDYDIIIDTVVEDYDKEMEELINESN